MARAPVQPTPPTWISLREARELVTQRYLSPLLADKLLVEWLDAGQVQWRCEHIENDGGVSTETALKGFWRSASINWDESSAARRVEPRTVAGASGGVLPGGIIVRSQHRPTQPSSRVGNNFVVYGIRLAREDIFALLPQTDPQGDRKRARPQGDRIMIALCAEFPPDGTVPPPSELSDSDLVARVSQRFPAPKKSGDPLIPGRKSILRAAGRLPRK
jgi:hypothetical protein